MVITVIINTGTGTATDMDTDMVIKGKKIIVGHQTIYPYILDLFVM